VKWKGKKETRSYLKNCDVFEMASRFSKDGGLPGRDARNPKLKAQARKVLRAHYAAKYRPR
jgi:hypothetical protein